MKSAKVQMSSLQCCLSAVAEFVGQLQKLLGEWQHGVAIAQHFLAVTVPQP